MRELAGLLTRAQARLAHTDTPRLDAELLLAHTLDKPRSWLHAWPEYRLTDAELTAFEARLARRAQGEPLAYITGRCGFWSLDLKVTPATLIPRADSETLIEWALELIPPGADCSLADLGTGSGAIALALATERPACRLTATDLSPAALAVAQENAAHNGLSQIDFRSGRWLEPLAGERYALIASNPPYVAEGDPHLAALTHEPISALTSGADGLSALREIIEQAPAHLLPGGWLLLEHGWDQGAAMRTLLLEHGYQCIETRRDLAGHERISGGCLAHP